MRGKRETSSAVGCMRAEHGHCGITRTRHSSMSDNLVDCAVLLNPCVPARCELWLTEAPPIPSGVGDVEELIRAGRDACQQLQSR